MIEQPDVSRRLEEVREDAGFRSLRSFHEHLTSQGLDFSYTALRNYHDPDPEKGRMPPVSYLDAVSRTLGVGLVWLVRGVGHMYAGGSVGGVHVPEGKIEDACRAVREALSG